MYACLKITFVRHFWSMNPPILDFCHLVILPQEVALANKVTFPLCKIIYTRLYFAKPYWKVHVIYFSVLT